MDNRNKKRGTENGSVLFYILIAVALLAALSYAVASSNRSAGSGIDEERLNLTTTEMLEYANVIGNAVTQMRLRGCTDTQISFVNNKSSADYANVNAPADHSCDIFNTAGGGVQYLAPKAEWLDSTHSAKSYFSQLLFSGTSCVSDVGPIYDNCTTAAPASLELIMYIPFIKRDICIELNRTLGVGIAGGAPPKDSNLAWANTNPHFKGIFTSSISVFDVGTGYLKGKVSGCFEGDSSPVGGFHFYKVLIVR